MAQALEMMRRRIESPEDLYAVVRVMKALAAASIRQCERAVESLAEYNRTIEAGLASAVGGQSADVGDVSRLFDELADRVPDEIKDDWQVLARNFEKVAEALEGVDLASGETPSAEVLAKLQELSATFDSTEMQEAAGNIEEWARQNC